MAPVSRFGTQPGPVATMRLHDTATIRRLATNPGLALGEAYMDGTLIPVGCTIRAVIEVLVVNLSAGGSHAGQRVQARLRRLSRRLAPAIPPAARAATWRIITI